MLNIFIRLTLIITLGIAALIVALFLFKVVIFAAIVAAVVLGGLFAFNFLRRATVGSAIRPQ